jgi:hypothetical protein
MHTLGSYRDTHSELRHIIEELRAVLTLEQLRLRPNAKSAYELLCFTSRGFSPREPLARPPGNGGRRGRCHRQD